MIEVSTHSCSGWLKRNGWTPCVTRLGGPWSDKAEAPPFWIAPTESAPRCHPPIQPRVRLMSNLGFYTGKRGEMQYTPMRMCTRLTPSCG